MEHHIVLAAEKIGQLGPLPITNTLLVSWIITVFLAVLGIIVGRNMRLVPSGIQNIAELVLEYIYNLCEEVSHARTRYFFPFVATFFLYILMANWFGLFPGVGTITIGDEHHKVPLLRSLNSDLNMTLALAAISAITTHVFAIRFLGIKDYILKWVSLNPIMLFVGVLEIISEFTKVASLSLRLFGNIFAGEVVLTTVSTLSKYTAFVVPLPFYFLEIIVGVVQAAVFMMLTLVFMSILSEKHEAH